MKLGKLLIRLSFIANIVLALWVLSQRAQIRKMLQDSEESGEAVDRMIVLMRNNVQLVKDQMLRTVAENDQVDAFLAERGIYAD